MDTRALPGGQCLKWEQPTLRQINAKWPKPVGYDAAHRLVKLAQNAMGSFKLSGKPIGMPGTEARATTVATAELAAGDDRAAKAETQVAALPAENIAADPPV